MKDISIVLCGEAGQGEHRAAGLQCDGA